MKIRRGWFLVAVLSCTAFTGCISPSASFYDPRLTPLQVRAIQTRTYDNQKLKDALKTVINVLQDDGYLIDYGNSELGLLHGYRSVVANSQANVPPGGVATTEATVNVTEVAAGAKIRIGFQVRVTDQFGQAVLAFPVSDPKVYQEFFAKLDRGLFMEKQGL